MFESCAGSFRIHPSGFASHNCKNDSLSHPLKCLIFADSTVPWWSLCVTRVSHSCPIFKQTGMKNVTHLRCGTLRSRQFMLVNLACVGGAAPPQAALHRLVFNCRTHTPAPLWPPLHRHWGYKYHAGPRLNLQRSCPDSCRVKGHLAGRWRGQRGGAVALILPTAPGHSCFKCSRTEQAKTVGLLRGPTAACSNRECACGGYPALTPSPGLWLQAIHSRSNWLSVLRPCARCLQTKKLWRI